jgi:hypothetical protein
LAVATSSAYTPCSTPANSSPSDTARRPSALSTVGSSSNSAPSVLARLIEHFGGPRVSVSNLALKTRGSAKTFRVAAHRTQEALAEDELPALDDWADIDTEKRRAILSGFQQCLPRDPEQEFLRSELLDIDGAREWSRDISVHSF